MGLASFGTFAFRRARSRWGLTLLSLVGIVLIVGLLASIPVFTDSVGFYILRQELASYAFGNANPLLAMRYYRVPNAPEAMSVGAPSRRPTGSAPSPPTRSGSPSRTAMCSSAATR